MHSYSIEEHVKYCQAQRASAAAQHAQWMQRHQDLSDNDKHQAAIKKESEARRNFQRQMQQDQLNRQREISYQQTNMQTAQFNHERGMRQMELDAQRQTWRR